MSAKDLEPHDFGHRRESMPRLDELLPEEERKIQSRLSEALQDITSGDQLRETYIAVVQEGVRKEPHEFIYHYVSGTAYSFRGELEKAKEILEKASSLKPDDPRPLYHLGAIYYTVWNVRNEEQSGETAQQIYRWEKETLSKFRKSSISRESASANALHYFRKVLACDLHPVDRKSVEEHIRIIETVSRLRLERKEREEGSWRGAEEEQDRGAMRKTEAIKFAWLVIFTAGIIFTIVAMVAGWLRILYGVIILVVLFGCIAAMR